MLEVGREIEGRDIVVGRIEGVDGMGKVELVCIVVEVWIEFVEVVDEVIVV